MEQTFLGRMAVNPILFAGGDQRTLAALEYLTRRGIPVLSYALTNTDPVTVPLSGLVLPYPALKDGALRTPLQGLRLTIEDVMEQNRIPPHLPATGGPLPQRYFSDYTDLSLREDLKLRNAVTTAEGALELILHNTDRALFGMSCLIIGYGAIGARLAQILSALGAKVTVAARRPESRLQAELAGCGARDTAGLRGDGFDVICNTVPARLLSEEALRECRGLMLELASAPGGWDPVRAGELGCRHCAGAALPGKVAPVTAGEDLAKTVIDILIRPQEKGSGTVLGT